MPEPADEATPDQAISVLLVEDDEATHYATSRFLQSVGYRVTSAMNGMSALDALDLATFDIVVIDCIMPLGTLRGPALGRMIRNRFPATPFLFITGYPDIAMTEEAMPDAPILLKPLDLSQLHATICKLLE